MSEREALQRRLDELNWNVATCSKLSEKRQTPACLSASTFQIRGRNRLHQGRAPINSNINWRQPHSGSSGTVSTQCPNSSTGSASGRVTLNKALPESIQHAEKRQPIAPLPAGSRIAAPSGQRQINQMRGGNKISSHMTWKRSTAPGPIPSSLPSTNGKPNHSQHSREALTSVPNVAAVKTGLQSQPNQPQQVQRKLVNVPTPARLKHVSHLPGCSEVESKAARAPPRPHQTKYKWTPSSVSSNKVSMQPPTEVPGSTVLASEKQTGGADRVQNNNVQFSGQLKGRSMAFPKSHSVAGRPSHGKFKKSYSINTLPTPSKLKWRCASHTQSVNAGEKEASASSHSEASQLPASCSIVAHPKLSQRKRLPLSHPVNSKLRWRRTSISSTPKTDGRPLPPQLPAPAKLRWKRQSFSVSRQASPSKLKWRRVSSGGGQRRFQADIPTLSKLKWRRASLDKTGQPSRLLTVGSPSKRQSVKSLPSPRALRWRRKSLESCSPLKKTKRFYFYQPLPVPAKLRWRKGNPPSVLAAPGSKPPVSRYTWTRGGQPVPMVRVPAVKQSAVQRALYGLEGWNSFSVRRHMRYTAKRALTPASKPISRRRASLGLGTPARRKASSLTPRRVAINGKLFRSTSRKLQRLSPQPSVSGPVATSPKKKAGPVVVLHGDRYQIESSGLALRRIDPVASISGSDGSSTSQSRLKLGGVMFQASQDGHYIRCTGASTTAVAREKVRRSIQLSHTRPRRARVNAAKRFCAYYNRFGRCRQDRCAFIHDPGKIAVCTKFLRGQCDKTDETCLLSHTLSKNKVPVCSFFLQGTCNGDNCQYSHVNVSKNAAVCNSFIDGYCPRGEKCTMKHVEACVNFKARKICRDSNCHFYHGPGWKKAAEGPGSSKTVPIRSMKDTQEPGLFRAERLRKQSRQQRDQPTLHIQVPSDNDDDNDVSGETPEADLKKAVSPLRTKPSFLL